MLPIAGALVQSASERLKPLMHNLVGVDIAALRKALAAEFADVWALACVPSFMCLRGLV
jgi:hypothetical protein